MRLVVFAALVLTTVGSLLRPTAGLAATIAVGHPSLWPAPIDSKQGFDRASRAELMVYAAALDDATQLNPEELARVLATKTFSADSVAHWLERERARVLSNYGQASDECAHKDWTCIAPPASFSALVAAARSVPRAAPAAFAAWHADMAAFSQDYALEQLRLAAVFPDASNETGLFSDLEWTGEALPDRSFALTFDDGPTAAGGTTDQTLAMLKTRNKSAAFFLLGVRLQKRVADSGAAAVAALYGNQCVASHGWEHYSHATWNDWQGSVTRTKALLNATFGPASILPLFRPPNGARKADSRAFFASQSLHVALWNIDAYDWNGAMDGDSVAARMITLILLRRHGVVLMHDKFPNALAALPTVFAKLGKVIDWPDCHRLAQL